MSRPPKYGIIYNWDGAPHGYSAVPQSMENFLEKAYAPLEDTQVGALFWSVGEHRALWSSQVLEVVGEAEGRRYDSVANYTATENVRQMLDRGEDPHTALIARGRELGLQVYASIRMNDNHFAGAQIADLPALYKAGNVTRRRFEHPEWLLGEEAPEWFALSWNMAVPEVREHRFAHIREICRRYDWDGVELDWQRHAFHFPRDQGYRLRYLLTDVQRAVRRLARELAAERGRPFHVAARVAGSLEMCRRIGYDVPAWIEEDLADMLIPAGGAVTDASLEVEAFVDLCRGSSIAVYPGFDSGLPDPFVGPEEVQIKDQMRTRAIASRYHRAGADGIYVFNWHANRDSKRPLLTTIGSTATLRHTDKIYAATHRFVQRQGPWRGAYQIDRLHGQVPVALKRTLTGQGPEIVLDLADDVRADGPASVELRLRLDQWVEGDAVRVAWDGAELQGAVLHYCDLDNANPPGGAFQPLPSRRRIGEVSSAVWLCFRLDPPTPGAHRVGIDLVERQAQMDCDIVLTDVEVVLRYGAEEKMVVQLEDGIEERKQEETELQQAREAANTSHEIRTSTDAILGGALESAIAATERAGGDEDVPVFDPARLEDLRELEEGGYFSLEEFIGNFVADTVERIAALRQAIDAEDAAVLERQAHTLKGSCTEVGAVSVRVACQKLEELGASGSVDGAFEVLEQLEEHFDQAGEALEAYLQNRS